MNVLVLLSTIVDTKWTLGQAFVNQGTAFADDGNTPRKLSPFDEATLELALRLRERDASTTITAIVFEPKECSVTRAVAAYRPLALLRVEHAISDMFDIEGACLAIRSIIANTGRDHDLILIGREFGDFDDGALPSYLAESLGFAFFGHASQVHQQDGGLVCQRSRGPCEETATLQTPVVVGIVNHKANRLRHPLLKNVMLSKRETVPCCSVPPSDLPLAASLLSASLNEVGKNVECRFLEGSRDSQIADLAEVLRGYGTPI